MPVECLVGFSKCSDNKIKEYYIINLTTQSEFHIHKSKFNDSKPFFIIFENETKLLQKQEG